MKEHTENFKGMMMRHFLISFGAVIIAMSMHLHDGFDTARFGFSMFGYFLILYWNYGGSVGRME